MLIASFLYSGYSDYFSGYDCADNEYLLYAYYGPHTTLRDIIDQLVDDGWTGSASEELPEETAISDVRVALFAMLSDEGRADYGSDAIAECSADMERLTECPDCDVELPDGEEVCLNCGKQLYDYESPIFIIVLRYEKEE